jgi:RHH-type proline utilization regulon transcriptional repressor/proline dehydrogenase/delta 1-pyrroline-5-carboxylate dehydrogenase
MKIMGKQYVLGQTIDEGLERGAQSNPPGTRFSFDVLGEGARTDKDARRYFKAYSEAIDTIGKASGNGEIHVADGISVKLSALHPRYHYSHREQVMEELLPRIRELAIKAGSYNIGLSIDAEESDRLDISMDIFEALAFDPELSAWDGLGFVLQAYLKRSPLVADWLIELAKASGHRLLVRLVKGAYWDAEIKHAQEQGLADYPVYTRKVNSDLCYLVCAEKLFAATEQIYPQFATHNAQTAAQILTMAGDRDFEFQRLHGMGLQLYRQLQKIKPDAHFPLRLYAPVGRHKDLLPYLVRRLLENGANSSFVNRFLDEKIPVDELIVAVPPQVKAVAGYRHKQIPLPAELLIASGEQRRNARGIDLNNPLQVGPLLDEIAAAQKLPWRSGPIVAGKLVEREMSPVLSPTDHRVVAGQTCKPLAEDIEQAMTLAAGHQPAWDAAGGGARAECLEKMADLLEENCEQLMGLISLEGGRTIDDTLSEVREAVDFCRYYALQARKNFGPQSGLNLEGRGVFLCISPWNFPLAIFTGQIAAALAAGNAVLAKPANPTTLIAARTVQLFHQAGIPVEVLHLVPGRGSQLGGQLIPDARLSGIALTGSTETAQMINRQLARRPGPVVPMIAETGGQNAMLVDSTALPEQLVDDVIASAFLSAGQRCSALRVLFLQEDIADNILDMLRGALQTYGIGDPSLLATDVGPVIDQPSQQALLAHIERMNAEAKLIAACTLEPIHGEGTFVAPHVFEIESLAQLPEEVFGPVLHVIRYTSSDLDRMLKQIRDTGYGLTLGIHSRIEAFARYVFDNTQVGNTYVNRNMVGAVVGVNPFGGQGLSGTGPKAGGPHYLFGFAREKVLPAAEIIQSGDVPLPQQKDRTALNSRLESALQQAKENQPFWDRVGPVKRAKCFEKRITRHTRFPGVCDPGQFSEALSGTPPITGPNR